MSYMRTALIKGHYAYRAWDGQWYVVNDRTGEATGDVFPSRSQAVDFLNTL